MCVTQPFFLPHECEKKLNKWMYNFDFEEHFIGYILHYHYDFLTPKIP